MFATVLSNVGFAVHFVGGILGPGVESDERDHWRHHVRCFFGDATEEVWYAGLEELGERLLLKRRQREPNLVSNASQISELFTHFFCKFNSKSKQNIQKKNKILIIFNKKIGVNNFLKI